MGILNKLLGAFNISKAQAAQQAPDNKKDLIEVFDQYGRKILISKEEWRKEVLPANIKKVWDNPDELYQIIVLALNDKHFMDVLEASERFLEIDKNRERGYATRSVVLMENGRTSEAKAVLEKYIKEYGEAAYILVNLAQIYHKEGNQPKFEEYLWKTVQADPNQEKGLGWWVSIKNEKSGRSAYIEELKKVAQMPGSWRAQLWLAREALEAKDLSKAMDYYKHVLSIAQDIPAVLMQISGDLGRSGHYKEVFEIVLPVYTPEKHGVVPGLNILQAYLESRDYEHGRLFLDRMFALKREDIRDRLLKFATDFDAKSKGFPKAIDKNEKISATMVVFDKPIFVYGLRNADWLFSDDKKNGARIAIEPLAVLDNDEKGTVQHETDEGRLTRSIPLYLSERLYYESNGYPSVFISVVSSNGGLITASKESTVGDFLETLAKGEDQAQFDYYISGTLRRDKEQLEINLSVWDCKTREKVKTFSKKAALADVGKMIRSMADDAIGLLRERKVIASIAPVSYYQQLKDDDVYLQLLCYGQALVQVLVSNGLGTKDTIHGERAILRNALDLAINGQGRFISMALFFSDLIKAYWYKSDVVGEFKDYALQLLKDNKNDKNLIKLSPVVYKAFGMTQEIDAFERELGKYPENYQKWFEDLKTASGVKSSPAELSKELRDRALAFKRTDLDNVPTAGPHGVYGVLMEIGMEKATITLAAYTTGDASLYYSSGGGMIGGIGHETVKKAAIKFNEKAEEYVSRFNKTNEFPLAKEGQTIFYVLTDDGIYTTEAVTHDLGNQGHPLFPLFYAGQNVITEYRLVSNDFQGGTEVKQEKLTPKRDRDKRNEYL